MGKNIDQLIKQAVKEHKIDRPILSTRVVGNKLELFLLGGDVLAVPFEGTIEETPPVARQPSKKAMK